MQGGEFGSLCFLAFLLSGVSGENLVNTQDLKHGGQNELLDDFSDTYVLESQGHPGLSNTVGNSDIRTVQLSDLDYAELNPEERSAFSSARAKANSVGGLNPGLGYGRIFPQSLRPSSANTGGYALADSGASSFLPGSYGPQSGYGSASAEANAQAISGGSSQAQADALAIAKNYDNGNTLNSGNLLPYMPYNSNSDSSYAQAQALANAIASAQGLGYSPYSLGPNVIGYPNIGSGYAQADAEAIAQAQASGYGGSSSSDSNAVAQALGGNLGQGQSSAEAIAQALAQPQLQGQPVMNNGYPTGGLSSAEANALVQALGNAGIGWSPGLGYSSANALAESQSLGQAQSQSQAQAQAQSQSQSQGLYGPSLAQAQALAQGIGYGQDQSQIFGFSNAQGSALANVLAGARTRVIPQNEYVFPHDIPGGENILLCSREGEMHNFWSSAYQCLVCTCINQNGYLRPVCASCAGCMAPPFEPEPLPLPLPPSPSPPVPEPQVSCDPLPTETPFESPLNPCQICVCHLTLDVYGRPDVQVVCQDNPACLEIKCYHGHPSVDCPNGTLHCGNDHENHPICKPSPELRKTLRIQSHIAPLELMVPILPMPLCKYFPENVTFPHPNDECSTCKCIVNTTSSLSVPEILCNAKPDCGVTPQPFPLPPIQPIPPMPSPLPQPVPEPMPLPMPLPLPEPMPLPMPLPEPLPMPPIPEPVPSPVLPPAPVQPFPPPGPLPGPSPHKSCRPYLPNQPFAHPWDECQECVCTELYAPGIINIEVNCYTKSECCIVPPPYQLPLPPSPPVQPLPLPNQQLQVLDQVCEYRGIGLEFIHPQDRCRICTCETFGNLVAPVCKPANRPDCATQLVPYRNIQYIEPRCRYRLPLQPFVIDCSECTCQPVFNYVIATCKRLPNCGVNPLYPGGSFSSADAYANTQSNAILPYSPKPQLIPFSPLPGVSQASAEAIALANNNLQGSSPGNLYSPAQPNSELLPYLNSGVYNPVNYGSAVAEADASTYSGYGQYLPTSLPGSSSSSVSDAQAFSGSGLNGLISLPYSQQGLGYLPDLTSTLTESEAIANANSGYNSGYNPFLSGLNIVPGSSASALANADAATSGINGLNSYPALYPSLGLSYQPSLTSALAESETNSGLYGGSSASASSEANTISNSANPFLYQPYSNIGTQYGLPSGMTESDAMNNANSGLSSSYLPGYLTRPSTAALAEAEALSDANLSLSPLLYGQNPNLSPSSQNGASANAEAIANALGYYPSSGASASAQAESDAVNSLGLNPLIYQSYPNLQSYQPNYSSGLSQVQTLANANKYSPSLSPYSSGSTSFAEAEAIANANSLYSQPMQYPSVLFPNSPGNSYASSNALSEASSNLLNYSPYTNSFPFHPGSSLSSANAEAEAIANAGLGGQMNPYQPSSGNSAQAQAQAVATADGYGQSSAQSVVQASAQSGRTLIKSANFEDENRDEDQV
ncbi:unnamed protein product, partial [Iphiclides podalirius]